MRDYFVVSHHVRRRSARAELHRLHALQRLLRDWLHVPDTSMPPDVRWAAEQLLLVGVNAGTELDVNPRRRTKGWPWVVRAWGRRAVDHPTPPGP